MIFRSALVSVALGVAGLGVMLALEAGRDMPVTLQLPTHRVRAVVRGAGSPTVVLQAFGSAPAEMWNRVSRDVAEFASVFSYDHAGYWGSQPGPKPRDARQIAMELHAALAAAGKRPPYLLVGYSFGGPYTRVFADLYPHDVAGLVLVDPTQEAFIVWLRRCVPWFNVVSGEDRALQNEWGCQAESMQQASAARLPDVPLTLITATATPDVLHRNLVPRILDAHARWLSAYPGARHVLATNSDHGIVLTHPELVTAEIRSMVTRIRDARPVPSRAGAAAGHESGDGRGK